MDSTITRYAPVFKDGDDEYLFIQILGEGIQGQAQLVLHVQSGEYRVRKVSNVAQTLDDIKASGEKNEANVLQFLQTEALKLDPQVRPHVVTFHGSSDAELPTKSPVSEDERVFVPVIYLTFYNGGDFFDYPENMPTSILLRKIAHIAHALKFLYDNKVMHGDLHDGNVFVNFPPGDSRIPDFYLGDFGLATMGCPERGKYFHKDVQYLLAQADPLRLSKKTKVVFDELTRLFKNRNGATGLPELTSLLALVDQAVLDVPVTEADLDGINRPSPPEVMYYKSVEKFTGPEADLTTGIIGPYQAARVRLDSAGRFQELLSIDEKIYDDRNDLNPHRH